MISRPDELQTAVVAGGSDVDDLAALPSIVAEIVETMRRGNVEQLDVSRGDFRLSLRAFPRDNASRVSVGGRATAASLEPGPDEEEDEDEGAGTHAITSPMIGTFYVAPAPGEAPFVQPGDVIEQDQVIGIVEAMKIMNEIAADRAGRVIEILASDGDTVEYGSPLVRLALDT